MAGKDATDPFTNYHPASVWKKLSVYCIGEVADDGPTAFMKEYRKMREDLIVKGEVYCRARMLLAPLVLLTMLGLGLLRLLLPAGYFATNYWYYVRLGLWLLTLAATAFYLTLAVKVTSAAAPAMAACGASPLPFLLLFCVFFPSFVALFLHKRIGLASLAAP